jgi:hypothetical protein
MSFEEWSPGVPGKGWLLSAESPDGALQLRTVRTEGAPDGPPHGLEAESALGIDEDSILVRRFYIEPSGYVQYPSPESVAGRRSIDIIRELDSRLLEDPPDRQEWHFEA